MKMNKWTVGLAAAGVVSLASTAQAEENSVLTSLSSTVLSGSVEASYVDLSAATITYMVKTASRLMVLAYLLVALALGKVTVLDTISNCCSAIGLMILLEKIRISRMLTSPQVFLLVMALI